MVPKSPVLSVSCHPGSFSLPTFPLYKHGDVKNSFSVTGVAKSHLLPELGECFIFHHTPKVMAGLQVVCINDFLSAPACGLHKQTVNTQPEPNQTKTEKDPELPSQDF